MPTPPLDGQSGLPFWQTTVGIVLFMVLCFPVGLVGLWKRPGVSARVRWIGTAAVVLLMAVFVSLPDASTNDDRPQTAQRLVDDEPSAAADTPDTAEPTPAEVPDVTGLSRADARTALIAAGLTVGGVRKQPSSEPAGTILRQDTPAGTDLERGEPVTLVVASPLPRVPDVVGRTQDAAVARLRELGFRVETSKRSVSSGPDGVVLSQSPRGGNRVQPRTTVHLVIADYTPPPPKLVESNCTPGYSPCLPPASDYDCEGGSGDGPKYTGLVHVTGSDPYDLDRDGDGIGCD